MSNPPRVVYDCNVFVQALINPLGPGGKCVEMARDGKALLFVSQFILEEIRESYLKVPAKYGVTQQQTEALAFAVASVATEMMNVPEVFVHARDPDDAHYVNVAIAAKARLIVSRDRDLLDLMNGKTFEGASFLSRFPEILIVDPVAFIKSMIPPIPPPP